MPRTLLERRTYFLLKSDLLHRCGDPSNSSWCILTLTDDCSDDVSRLCLFSSCCNSKESSESSVFMLPMIWTLVAGGQRLIVRSSSSKSNRKLTIRLSVISRAQRSCGRKDNPLPWFLQRCLVLPSAYEDSNFVGSMMSREVAIMQHYLSNFLFAFRQGELQRSLKRFAST